MYYTYFYSPKGKLKVFQRQNIVLWIFLGLNTFLEYPFTLLTPSFFHSFGCGSRNSLLRGPKVTEMDTLVMHCITYAINIKTILLLQMGYTLRQRVALGASPVAPAMHALFLLVCKLNSITFNSLYPGLGDLHFALLQVGLFSEKIILFKHVSDFGNYRLNH